MDSRHNTYREVNVNTMNRGKIVVMLFSGAINFLNKAKEYIEQKDYFQKGKFINKAQNIIDELNYSLDMERGREISKNLRSIYLFLTRHLTQASIKNDPQMIAGAIKILTDLKSAFEEIVNNPKYEEARAINKKNVVQNSIRKLV
jgi:flagellar protein FliS